MAVTDIFLFTFLSTLLIGYAKTDCKLPAPYDSNCKLDLFVDRSLHESVDIVGGNYSVQPARYLKTDPITKYAHKSCYINQKSISQNMSVVSNGILNLIPKLNNSSITWEELANINSSLECLGKLVNEIDSPSLSQYLSNQYVPFVTSKVYDVEMKIQQLKFEHKNESQMKVATCKIKLSELNESINATDSWSDKYSQRFVFYTSEDGPGNDWILESKNPGNTFKLRNSKYNEYLGSVTPWYDSSIPARLVTSIQFHDECDSRFIWELVRDSKGSRLKHSQTNGFLFLENGVFPFVSTNDSGVYVNLDCTGFVTK